MPGKRFNGIRGIIFDLDGTLIDSFRAIMDGFNATLPFYGLKPLTLEETKAIVGRPLPETFADMLGKENADDATRTFRKRYKEVYLDKTVPMPHATEVVKYFHKKGCSMGIATNKHGGFSRDIIEHLGWGGMIGTVVGEGDTPKNKPAPDMILKNLSDMSISSEEAIFVGDSPVDMETGINSGVRTIGVPTGYHTGKMLMDAGAERIIDDLSQLKGLFSP